MLKWRDLFNRENTIAKEGVSRAVDAHANQHDVLAAEIHQAQDQYATLEHQVAIVLANATQAQERLERDLTQERQLDAQGKAAAQAGHADAAAAIATQLVAIRSRLEIEKRAFDLGQANAAKAKNNLKEAGEALRAKMAEAKELDAAIDETAMEHNMNIAMESMSAVSSHGLPSFDEVRDRINAAHATESATASLREDDPAYVEVHEAHLINTAAADAVMASWGSGGDGASASSGSGSPTDRLNS